jgi:hypothetical protein
MIRITQAARLRPAGYGGAFFAALPRRMVAPARFERATYRLGICCSILLSYGVMLSFCLIWLGIRRKCEFRSSHRHELSCACAMTCCSNRLAGGMRVSDGMRLPSARFYFASGPGAAVEAGLTMMSTISVTRRISS